MIILYLKSGCPYCVRVQEVLRGIGVPYESRNILSDEHRQALLLSGGKVQVPYLIDTEKNTALYESEDIVKYLLTHYAPR